MTQIWYSNNRSFLEDGEQKSKKGKVVLLVGMALFLVFSFGASWFLNHSVSPPADFPVGKQVKIESGLRVYEIGNSLEEENIIHSAWLFTLLNKYVDNSTSLQAGVYRFEEPKTVFAVLDKLEIGDKVTESARITFKEGQTIKEYALLLEDHLLNFSRANFLELVAAKEGFLFPDTYEFEPEANEGDVVSVLESTYESKMQPYRDEVASHALNEYEIITLASILEREANSQVSMRTVSGILQNRLTIGMALQADATVGYVLDKPLSELTATDLEIDSPYNTYLYNGLPPTPIGNPGMMAIEAVLDPIETEYLYYITGNDGNFYYATTFAEHRENIRQYLQ